MATSAGNQLAQSIRQKIEELKKVCEGLDESTASRAPAGRWSPKEILSHLCGPEGSGHLPILEAFLDRDTPRIDIEIENPFFSEKPLSSVLIMDIPANHDLCEHSVTRFTLRRPFSAEPEFGDISDRLDSAYQIAISAVQGRSL